MSRTHLLSVVLGGVLTASISAQPLDRQDPVAVARAGLTAAQQDDFRTLIVIGSSWARRQMALIEPETTARRLAQEVITGHPIERERTWMDDIVDGWNGATGQVRYRTGSVSRGYSVQEVQECVIEIGAIGRDTAVAVVQRENRQWGYHGVDRIPTPVFQTLSTVPTLVEEQFTPLGSAPPGGAVPPAPAANAPVPVFTPPPAASVATCPACGGAGSTMCMACGGDGYRSSLSNDPCGACGGQVLQTCRLCGGTGQPR